MLKHLGEYWKAWENTTFVKLRVCNTAYNSSIKPEIPILRCSSWSSKFEKFSQNLVKLKLSKTLQLK